MNPGRLRHRISIQQKGPVNTAGVDTGVWTEFCQCYAEIADLSGREYFAQQQAAADLTTRIVIRWRKGVMAQMRVIGTDSVIDPPGQNGTPARREWDIQSVIDPDGRHEVLHLMCKERIGEPASQQTFEIV
jgi:SPP1 family predicted phage head-tail adaptor